ncbi:MAG TPA: hypothetical protein ENN06_06660 [Desulfobacteraceae bacterium]|nr:hypothetical protein [Desulfobacteraceae bacterium]
MNGLPSPCIPSLAIMWAAGPMIGTVLVTSIWDRPELIMANELVGIPILLYSYITVSPVLIPASLLWCFLIHRYVHGKSGTKNRTSFFLFLLRSGAFIGLLCAILPGVSALFLGRLPDLLLWLVTGMAAGAFCALLCFPIWNTQFRDRRPLRKTADS